MKVKLQVIVFSMSLLICLVLSLHGVPRTRLLNTVHDAYRYFSILTSTALTCEDAFGELGARAINDRLPADERCLSTNISGLFNETLSENMTLEEADDIYFRFLFQRHFYCESHSRFGKRGDGGWDVCLTEPFRPTAPCLVYSFGINYDFSFDDAISTVCDCLVRSFDPSMKRVKDHRRSQNIWFYKIGLGGEDTVLSSGWKMKTLQTIVSEMNDTGKIIDYLKIDIEDNEWDSIKTMFKTNILMQVKQLGMEVHVPKNERQLVSAFYRRWKILKHLEQLGFRRWYWHLNPRALYKKKGKRRSRGYEMVYINKHFLSTN